MTLLTHFPNIFEQGANHEPHQPAKMQVPRDVKLVDVHGDHGDTQQDEGHKVADLEKQNFNENFKLFPLVIRSSSNKNNITPNINFISCGNKLLTAFLTNL